MPNWFAVYKVSTGALVSLETDDAERLTAPQLTAAGLARKAIAGPLAGFETWDPGTQTITAAPAASINPPVTRVQAAAILKALLETPPTAGTPWTKLQSDQAIYALLLGAFRDLQNGKVY